MMAMLEREMKKGWKAIPTSLFKTLFDVQPEVMQAILKAKGKSTRY